MALTTKQQAFALAIAEGATATAAARMAGYADSSAQALRVGASRLANDSKIQQAVFQHRERRLQGPLASKALACLEGVMDDETAPPAARITAAKFILEAAGHGIENRRLAIRHPQENDRQLSDYTLAELEAMANAAEVRLKIVQGQVIDGDDSGAGGELAC